MSAWSRSTTSNRSAGPARLANISTRGRVETGSEVMIGGFIVGGSEPAKMLVRGIGSSLRAAGVAEALEDPTLELHDAVGDVVTDDSWRSSQENQIIATTIPPKDDLEPAILQTLVPGAYTAILRGTNDSTGVGLVEVYNLP